MPQNISYPNVNFGKNNWFYWSSFFLLIWPLFASILFLIFTFHSGYEVIVRLLMLIGVVYFLNIFIKGFIVLKLSFKTASRVIVADNGSVELTTYPGSTSVIKSASIVEDVTEQFTKQHYQLLFPSGCCVFKLISNGREYFLPIDKKDTDYLTSLENKKDIQTKND